ncbi:rhamnosyltransferase, partial [Escherichia coli]
ILWIPVAFINNFMKICGYKLGLIYKKLPKKLVIRLSMLRRYWL